MHTYPYTTHAIDLTRVVSNRSSRTGRSEGKAQKCSKAKLIAVRHTRRAGARAQASVARCPGAGRESATKWIADRFYTLQQELSTQLRAINTAKSINIAVVPVYTDACDNTVYGHCFRSLSD